MRRKLFFYAVILLVAVFLVDTLFPDIWVPEDALPDKSQTLHRGRIVMMNHKDDHWNIILKDERGFRVRLGYYSDLERPWELMEKEISYEAKLTVPDVSRNPGCFDYRRYMRSQGEYLKGTLKTWEIMERSGNIYQRYKAYLYRLKCSFSEFLPDDMRGMMIGMIFGDTGDLSEDIYEDFRRNGTAHILAVSGLHISLIYSIYEKISKGRTGPVSVTLLILLMFTYGTLSSWRPSVIRAEVMILMKTIARIGEYRYDSLTSMSAAFIILVITNPYVIYGQGFQMSFLAITSINILVKIMPYNMPDSVAQTIAVSATLMIYQAYSFNYISPLSFLVNIPMIYLAGWAIPLVLGTFGGYSLISSVLCLAVPVKLMIPAVSMTRFLVKVNSLLSMGGRTSFDVPSPPKAVIIFVIAFILFNASEYAELLRIRKERKRTAIVILVILIISFLSGALLYEPIRYDQVVFIDVGQGASTHIRMKGTDVLIDGGGSRTYSVGEKSLKPYLLKNGAWDLDLALATHEDMDHKKGLDELNECFKVKKYLSGAKKGDRFCLSKDVDISVLWPLELKEGEEQENENSSVFLIRYMGVRILVTGDLDQDGEKAMIAYYRGLGKEGALKADVLNVGHHGSKTSTSDEFLNEVRPKVAVIQVGKNNYGHPSREVIDRLKEHGIRVYRNDYSGAVGLRITKDGLKDIHVMIRKQH